MTRKLISILSVVLLTFALTGCSANQVVRGQCPPGGGRQGMMRGGCMSRTCGGRGVCGSSACGGNGAGNKLNLPFHPVHRNYVNYKAPRNLSYPQQNTPAATVQYPYYTLKGPTDFFMK